MSSWEIIKQTSVQGVVEYCVSDGQVGERTFSWDFNKEELLCLVLDVSYSSRFSSAT